MRMIDLFSGIGGFALAAEWCWKEDLEIVTFCEIEDFPKKILKKNFPTIPIHDDIRTFNGDNFKNIDLITGGFPCQDISSAGKGAGIEGERSGLWTEMYRIISEIRPRYAIIENVSMLIHRGLEQILCDLTQIGYDSEWQIIGADEVGARHRRKRVWIVSYPNSSGYMDWQLKEQPTKRGFDALCKSESGGKHERNVPDTNHKRCQQQRSNQSVQSGKLRRKKKSITSQRSYSRKRREFKIRRWEAEPELGRVAHGIPNRVDRLRGLGNSIVPQVAFKIMNLIKHK